jgi:hypothetical protein
LRNPNVKSLNLSIKLTQGVCHAWSFVVDKLTGKAGFEWITSPQNHSLSASTRQHLKRRATPSITNLLCQPFATFDPIAGMLVILDKPAL